MSRPIKLLERMMRVVDSHCHLDFDSFAGDLDAIVARARNAGVCRMVTISTRMRTFLATRALAERFSDIYCSVGVHPHHVCDPLAGDTGEGAEEGGALEGAVTLGQLTEAAAHPRVVGIGESGLDYFYDNAPVAAQKASFLTHIAAARSTGLPLIVHSRNADEDMADMLEAEYAKGAFGGVLHCFTGGPELARRAVEIGFYISLAGILTFRNAEDLRQSVRAVPRDRLLVETDAPYLAPVPERGKRNEPAYVRHTLTVLAEVLGLAEEDAAALTTENFFRLFAKVPQ